MKKEKKQWVNHKNEVIEDKYISGYDKRKEKAVLKINREAVRLNKQLMNFKKTVFGLSDAFFIEMFKEHNMEPTKQKNYTLYSFDKSIKIEVNSQDVINFDDRITMAQAKLNEFIQIKTKGTDQDIAVLINNAFTKTKGRLDKSRVLGLFTYKITHPLWLEAMELIKASITTNNTRRYASVWKRNSDGKYTQIQLNFSAL